MDWNSLPVDLQEEILSRVPAKSLARLRSTSKQWNALLKFANKHSANAPKESLIITLEYFRVYFVRVNYLQVHDIRIAPSVNLASQLFNLEDPQFKSSQVDIRKVFHCDGLLLCSTQDNRLVVCNPCSGETKWIIPRNNYRNSDFYALGYDNKSSCKNYKVLRVDYHRSHVQGIYDYNEYEIYDFTTDSWRVLGTTTNWLLLPSHQGVSVKGNTYWVALSSGAPYSSHEFLLSFDYSTERFRMISLPRQSLHLAKVLSVVREDQLCLTGTRITDLHVWVTTISTGSDITWRRLILLNFSHSKYYDFSSGVSLLANEHNKLMLCCNKYLQVYPHGGNSTRKLPCSSLLDYVPSLAHIQ